MDRDSLQSCLYLLDHILCLPIELQLEPREKANGVTKQTAKLFTDAR